MCACLISVSLLKHPGSNNTSKKKKPQKPALKRFENVVNCNKLLLSDEGLKGWDRLMDSPGNSWYL